jgi:lysophospholipase
MLIVSAGSDAIVANAAIDRFAIRLRAGSHVVIAGAQHEIMMEQDGYRTQFWAAFDAVVPGEDG